jgi:peptidoglycan/LPS O-acetylase OafA/YrhL
LPAAGDLGVLTFFVISGFLITLLLQRECARTGNISLGGFYLRRALRILPAYSCFLIVMFLVQQLGWQSLPERSWIASLTYTSSIFPVEGWELSHTWSLSVEEHFYLIWPMIFSVLGNHGALRVCSACVCAGPLLRAALLILYLRHNQNIEICSDLIAKCTLGRMDCIAAGCALALSINSRVGSILLGQPKARLRWLFWAAAAMLFLCRTSSNILHRNDLVAQWQIVFAPTVSSMLVATMLWCCVNDPRSIVHELLDARPLRALGVFSYSLYLWQQVFITPARGTGIFDFPFNMMAAFGAALLSYSLVEAPFLRLKRRIEKEGLPVFWPLLRRATTVIDKRSLRPGAA